jgi:hypothetical protein
MRSISIWVNVFSFAALVTCSPALSEEPPNADSPAVQQGQILATLDNANRVADLANAQVTLLDFSNSLVAANGLGIDVASPEGALRAQLALDEGAGLVVTAVPDQSGGAKAGIKVHDLLVQLGDQKVGDVAKLNELLDAADGKPVKLRILRGGKSIEIEATPKKPELALLKLANFNRVWTAENLLAHQEHYRIGVTLAEADDTLRAQLRLAASEGLVVTEIVDGGAAALAGIQTHDVLVMLDGKRLTTVEAINAQIQDIKEKQVELRLLRGGKEMTVQIAPRKTQEAAFADNPLIYWDTRNCKSCHSNVHEDPHKLMSTKFLLSKSAWTHDAHGNLLEHLSRGLAGQSVAAGPQQQIDAIKSQLGQLQQTIAALEATLKPAATKQEEKKE